MTSLAGRLAGRAGSLENRVFRSSENIPKELASVRRWSHFFIGANKNFKLKNKVKNWRGSKLKMQKLREKKKLFWLDIWVINSAMFV